MNWNELEKFYSGKSVLVTGHTGFKGSWLTRMLTLAGAKVTGYSLNPPTDPSLFEIAGLEDTMDSVIGDVRDLARLQEVFERVQPQVVFHLAAQPIVRDSYKDPVYTYETNVMGTVNVLECVRRTKSVQSFLNVTTDKVYENKEWEYGYRECDPLDGYDPYSNSKSCSELVTHSREIAVRNPHSTRPYQLVLEPLAVYMAIAMRQWEDRSFQGYYNVGPDDKDCVTTGTLVDLFCAAWGPEASWVDQYDGGPHEANFLKLDCSKIKRALNWTPRYGVKEAIEKTVAWSKEYLEGADMLEVMDRQIREFFA